LFVFFMNSCSSSDDNIPEEGELPEDNLEISVTSTSQTYEIDELVEFVISCEENMNSAGITTYRVSSSGDTIPFSRSLLAPDGEHLGKEVSVKTGFMSPGKTVIGFTARNVEGKTVEKKMDINVVSGDAVKIKSLEILSFYRKEEVWDSGATENAPYKLTNFMSL